MMTLMFRPHKYEGGHHAQDLADFVEDILRPVVVPLTVSDYLPSDIVIYTFLTRAGVSTRKLVQKLRRRSGWWTSMHPGQNNCLTLWNGFNEETKNRKTFWKGFNEKTKKQVRAVPRARS